MRHSCEGGSVWRGGQTGRPLVTSSRPSGWTAGNHRSGEEEAVKDEEGWATDSRSGVRDLGRWVLWQDGCRGEDPGRADPLPPARTGPLTSQSARQKGHTDLGSSLRSAKRGSLPKVQRVVSNVAGMEQLDRWRTAALRTICSWARGPTSARVKIARRQETWKWSTAATERPASRGANGQAWPQDRRAATGEGSSPSAYCMPAGRC